MDARILSPLLLGRGLLLFGAVVVPAFGLVYRVVAPDDVDPFAARLAFGAGCLALFAGSWLSPRIEQQVPNLLLAVSYVVDAHMIALAAANGFSGDRAVAILVVFFCVVLSFRTARQTVVFGAVTAVLTSIGYQWAPSPDISQPVLQGSLLLVISVIAVATESRARLAAGLERSHRELEQRVEQRTHELAESLLGLEREVLVRKRAETEATAANVAKSAFLANMSHELRTPLNAILGYTEMLLEEAQSLALSSFSQDLGRVRRAAAHLLAMIGHILDLAAIEAGKLRLEAHRTALRPLLEEVCETARPLLDVGHNTLVVDCPLDVSLDTDPDRLRQILLNLLSNAAKFTDEGAVEVRVSTAGGRVRIAVADTGIGIPADVLPTLFAEFTQVDGTSTRRFGGTGLGLAISRRLARALGGDVTVDSTVGRGTCFTVEL